MKFTNEEKIATYFEFFSIFLSVPVAIKINIIPIIGTNIMAERIGKFILK